MAHHLLSWEVMTGSWRRTLRCRIPGPGSGAGTRCHTTGRSWCSPSRRRAAVLVTDDAVDYQHLAAIAVDRSTHGLHLQKAWPQGDLPGADSTATRYSRRYESPAPAADAQAMLGAGTAPGTASRRHHGISSLL